MTNPTVERFMEALQSAESTRDPAPLSELFADDAELTNLATSEPHRGRDGAHQFWKTYLEQFERIRSEFSNVIRADGDAAVLEWQAQGTMSSGRPIDYRGITVLELDGERVRKFRTYYDSASFVQAHAQF